MKIRAVVTVDVDPKSWTLNYGIEGRAAIIADVRAYVEDLVQSQFGSDGIDVLVKEVAR